LWLMHERRYRQRAEAKTRETMSELTHMNRIAGAGELSASIAHEVNQPLSGIVTSANAALRWLERETPDVDRARGALNQIVSAGHRASQVVKNVRSIFKKETQEKAPVNVNDIILEVLALSRSELQRHPIPVQASLDEGLPDVMGNYVQLQQVILNLVMNAIEAMHSEPPRMLRVLSYRAKPDVVHVSIEDTGTGIDPANFEQIFKPLFTTKERGMGMGLSICQSIVESHGGRIWVSNAAYRGSIFQFELPAFACKDKADAVG